MATDSDEWGIASGVGLTALMTAACRALESSRPGGLIRDPLAAEFVRAASASIRLPVSVENLMDMPAKEGRLWIRWAAWHGVRTIFFDRCLYEALGRGIRQVVIVGAGLDLRGFRLEWPSGSTVVEIDRQAVLAFKETVLRHEGVVARCERQAVHGDLREDWAEALTKSTFDPRRPTMWLAEGLLAYLSPDQERGLLERVHLLSAPGSELAFNHFVDMALGADDIRKQQGVSGVDFSSLLPLAEKEDPGDVLAALGWGNTNVSLGELLDSHSVQLEPPLPPAASENSRFRQAWLR